MRGKSRRAGASLGRRLPVCTRTQARRHMHYEHTHNAVCPSSSYSFNPSMPWLLLRATSARHSMSPACGWMKARGSVALEGGARCAWPAPSTCVRACGPPAARRVRLPALPGTPHTAAKHLRHCCCVPLQPAPAIRSDPHARHLVCTCGGARQTSRQRVATPCAGCRAIKPPHVPDGYTIVPARVLCFEATLAGCGASHRPARRSAV